MQSAVADCRVDTVTVDYIFLSTLLCISFPSILHTGSAILAKPGNGRCPQTKVFQH